MYFDFHNLSSIFVRNNRMYILYKMYIKVILILKYNYFVYYL